MTKADTRARDVGGVEGTEWHIQRGLEAGEPRALGGGFGRNGGGGQVVSIRLMEISRPLRCRRGLGRGGAGRGGGGTEELTRVCHSASPSLAPPRNWV